MTSSIFVALGPNKHKAIQGAVLVSRLADSHFEVAHEPKQLQHRLYLHRIAALVTPLAVVLKSELLSFPNDVTQSVILKDFSCSLEPA